MKATQRVETENNEVRVYKKTTGELVSTRSYETADEAYKAFTETVEWLKKNPIKNEHLLIIRFRWGNVMCIEEIDSEN